MKRHLLMFRSNTLQFQNFSVKCSRAASHISWFRDFKTIETAPDMQYLIQGENTCLRYLVHFLHFLNTTRKASLNIQFCHIFPLYSKTYSCWKKIYWILIIRTLTIWLLNNCLKNWLMQRCKHRKQILHITFDILDSLTKSTVRDVE